MWGEKTEQKSKGGGSVKPTQGLLCYVSATLTETLASLFWVAMVAILFKTLYTHTRGWGL